MLCKVEELDGRGGWGKTGKRLERVGAGQRGGNKKETNPKEPSLFLRASKVRGILGENTQYQICS